MAAHGAQAHDRPVAIAPAPARPSFTDLRAMRDTSPVAMPYTCQACTRRKVKCDKTAPVCSSCRKGKLECSYHTPPPRRRKRRPSNEINEKLALYERILSEHGLMPRDTAVTPSRAAEMRLRPVNVDENGPEPSATGKLVIRQGQSRYIDDNIWRNFGDDDMQRLSNGEDEDQSIEDPLTGAFMGTYQNLLQYHPSHSESIILWNIHVDRVEPICKILHIPSTFKMVMEASQHPTATTRAEECLLFAIYHFAIFSMADEECVSNFKLSRTILLQKYHYASRQALVNANFLRTTEMSVIQALVLFLLSCRYVYDPHTYWILTGVAIRIAQRIGLHRDGEQLGLPPFDVQMRRRLFYQLLSLDGIASQISGTGIAVLPGTWDTRPPLNINDDQIYPGMTEEPQEKFEATEMMFCLARISVGKSFLKAGQLKSGSDPWESKNCDEVEPLINAAESEVEANYIRYCDVINPLHFLTIAFARSAVTAMRLRIRLPKLKSQAAKEVDKKELFHLSQKIMDTDEAIIAHTSLKKFQWHLKPFFLWGSWDSLIFVLTSLSKPSAQLTAADIDTAWIKVGTIYRNHGELLQSKEALQTAIRSLTLKAWNSNPPSSGTPEFITSLRSTQKGQSKPENENQYNNEAASAVSAVTIPSNSPIGTIQADASLEILPEGINFDNGDQFDFNADIEDWASWEHLIQDYQVKSTQ